MPAQRDLVAVGIQYLEQLTEFNEAEVKQWHGIGPNAFGRLRRALTANRLLFADGK